ncbi:MAG: DUF4386 domain-containing protein [Acidobacteriaceae bacterium]|nr:DUF4386 domain-containing protein [Acidobacteriaceae bacterium]
MSAVENARTEWGLSHPNARVTGFVYLSYFFTAILSASLLKGIIASGDVAGTIRNVYTQEPLFHIGLAVGLISVALYVALTARLYELFKAVNQDVSLLAAFFSLIGCATQAFGTIFEAAPLITKQSELGAFSQEQGQNITQMFLRLHGQAMELGFVFFGLYCVFIGYLILRSTFLPRFLGVVLGIAGLGWLTFLLPSLARTLSPYIQIAGIAAEALLMLWLLVFGIKVDRWVEQASTP